MLRFLLCAMLAMPALAENDCGRMMRTVSRFRGKVLSAGPIGKQAVEAVDLEPRFVATVLVESVEEAASPLKAGQTRRFGFADAPQLSGTLDLEAEWMQCHDRFRRFVGLRKRPAERVIESADQWLEPGHSYRADVRWSPEQDALTLVQPLDLPMHHGGGITWTNVDNFPRLPRDGTTIPVTFEVVSLEITHMNERRWLSIYELKLIELGVSPATEEKPTGRPPAGRHGRQR
jgi:hypothetical protein